MKDLHTLPLPVWEGDILKRRDIADYLTKYLVQRYEAKKDGEQGFVLAINADWGFGKTFLLKNWAKQLQNSDYPAVYFDAWQNDFTSEPLVAFIAEIDESLKPAFKNIPTAKKLLNQTVNTAKQLWKPTGKAIGRILVKRLVGVSVEELSELHDQGSVEELKVDKKTREEIIDALSKVYDSSLKDHVNRKQAICTFRAKLSLLIKALEESPKVKLPVFFFVDELDRCRPDYAIELLEGIKHLFGVPGIYFVIGTNLNQLGESAKAIYGSGFDGGRYLKRFFDLEYSLPVPDDAAFARSLFDTLTINDPAIFITKLSKEFYGEEHHASQLFTMYSQFFGLGLRDQQHVMRHIEAAVAVIKTSQVHAHYLFFLAMLNYKFPQSFEAIFERSMKDHNTFKTEMSKTIKKRLFIQSWGKSSEAFKPEQVRTPLEDIAWLYLSTAAKDLKELAKEEINRLDFPRNLLLEVSAEMPNPYASNKWYESSLTEYPKLIRQAGHFA